MGKYPVPKQGSFYYRIGGSSQCLNGWLGGNRDQTFSARTWEGKLKGVWWCIIASKVIDNLFFWTEAHTETSYYSDTEKSYK